MFLLAIIVGCAEVQPPSGGEADKKAPAIDSTLPANGTINVPVGNHVEVYFSENVQPGQGRQVFISPHPAKDPELKWHSDRLTIKLPENFQPNQTYVVNLNAAIADLHGNRMDSSLSIAFSTGPTLDSGHVGGRVLLNGSPQIGTLVGLYASNNLSDSLQYDSLYPNYLTASGKGGRFSLRHLPSQEYRLIAFIDKNRDDRFNPLREAFGVPDRPIVVPEETSLDSLVLNLTAIDTSKPEIVSATYSANNLVRVRFSKELQLDFIKAHLGDVRLVSAADSVTAIPALSSGESDQQTATNLSLYFGHISDGNYYLELQPMADIPVIRSSTITVRQGKDTEPPSIVRHTPGGKPMFLSDVNITMAFSEPVDSTQISPQTFGLSRGIDSLVPSHVQWTDPFHVALRPDTLQPGIRYSINVTEFEVKDLAGNALGDSLTSFPFTTLSNDSLGTISGTVEVTLEHRKADPVLLILREIRNAFLDTLTMQGRDFRIDVPAGRYILSAFIDSDKDGKLSLGSAVPYRFSETSAIYPDTVAVRARFETAEVRFQIK